MGISVIGRDDELGLIDAFLQQIGDGPTGLVMSGEPGIGKTILWEAGAERARARGLRVLSCRCAESEAALSFTGLGDLVAPVLAEVAPGLPPPRRHALEVAVLVAEPVDAPLDPRAVGLAFLDVCRGLAAQGEVVVAVDDVQWLDASSALVLQMALRRVREEHIGFLATLREAPGLTTQFDLERLLPAGQTTLRSLGPLSVGALHHLLRDRLGLDLVRPELVRLHGASAGNAFYALELGRELIRAGAKAARTSRPPGAASLRALLERRLDHLPSTAREVLFAVAALGRPTMELVSAACGEARTREVFDQAADDAVIEPTGAGVRFTHPLLASVCYERVLPSRRRAIHRLLAGVVPDGEERVRHLALAADGPDTVVAADLEAAAYRAETRGAIEAAELLDLAAELTPRADEETRRRRRMRGAWVYLHAGDHERAAVTLEQLLTETPPGGERADVLFQLAWARQRPDLVAQAYAEALAQADGDVARTARILADRSSWRLSRDASAALADARRALDMAEHDGDTRMRMRAIARLGCAETFTLGITPGLLEYGRTLEESFVEGHSFMFHDSPYAMLGVRLMFRDELDESRTILEHKYAELTSDGLRLSTLAHLIMLEWLSDQWRRALGWADVALELAEQVHDTDANARVRYAAALVEAHVGHVERARSLAEEALAIASAQSLDVTYVNTLGVLGHLELARGNVPEAAESLGELPTRLLSLGWREPSGPIWPDAIEALIGTGELDRARSYLDHYAAVAPLASRRCVAGSYRCLGLLAAAQGDFPAALSALDTALGELVGPQYPFERGRAWLVLGSIRRHARQKRLAREALEQAHVIFDELGARLWATRAVDELSRISGRKSAPEGLTQTEQRVAQLAAQGLSNKRIAATMFMSVHTVEAHLTRVYRKLGVHSRAELAHRLAPPVNDAAKA
jgi:DNA-binding CsgD family transcriptional regulator